MKMKVGLILTALAIGGAILYWNMCPALKDEVSEDMKRFKKDMKNDLQNMM